MGNALNELTLILGGGGPTIRRLFTYAICTFTILSPVWRLSTRMQVLSAACLRSIGRGVNIDVMLSICVCACANAWLTFTYRVIIRVIHSHKKLMTYFTLQSLFANINIAHMHACVFCVDGMYTGLGTERSTTSQGLHIDTRITCTSRHTCFSRQGSSYG